MPFLFLALTLLAGCAATARPCAGPGEPLPLAAMAAGACNKGERHGA